MAENNKKLPASEQLCYTTVRIEFIDDNNNVGIGTGFFFNIVLDGGKKNIPLIITNKHVVKGAKKGHFLLTLADNNGDPLNGQTINIELDNFESFWTGHPDENIDLTAMPIAPIIHEAEKRKKKVFYRALSKEFVASSSYLESLTPLEEIVMVGYPKGLWDSKNNLPIMRTGSTATHPGVKYNGKEEFMIDVACFPGSSGSPIFLFNQGSYPTKEGKLMIGTRIKFLGVLWGGPQHTTTGEIKIMPVPTKDIPIVLYQIPINLGYVVWAERVLDFEEIYSKNKVIE